MSYSFKQIEYKSKINLIPSDPNIYIKTEGNLDLSISYVKEVQGNIKIKRDVSHVITLNGAKLENMGTDILITYIDVNGVLEFYRNDSITTSPVVIVPDPIPISTGNILWEMWKGSSMNGEPTKKVELASFNAPQNQGNSYVARIRGYIIAPTTGNYTFYIAADDFGSLLLSKDDKVENAKIIASVPDWVNAGEYTRYPSQTSKAISLVAGQKYYIEANMTQGGGGDNLSVAWRLPNGVLEAPISKNLIAF